MINFPNKHKKNPKKGVKSMKSFHLHKYGLVRMYSFIFNNTIILAIIVTTINI